MKKIYWLFVFLCISLSSVHCQYTRYGMFINPGVSWLTSDNPGISSGTTQPDYNFGITADKYFAPNYIFSSGIGIHTIGGLLTYHNSTTLNYNSNSYELAPNTQVIYSFKYLHFPLAMKFHTIQIGNVTYFAQMGLDPMLNIQANANFVSNNITYSNISLVNAISFLYLGYDISAGLEYKIVGNTIFTFGFEYMNGFSNVITTGAGNNTLNSFEIRIGMFF